VKQIKPMVNKLTVGLSVLLGAGILGCKSNNTYVNKFSAFVSTSTEVNVSFGNRLDSTKAMVDTTISDPSEVERIKSFVALAERRDTCRVISGTITFLQPNGDGYLLDFSLDPKCPAYYFYTEGDAIAVGMSYRSGMYLAELEHLLTSRIK
jgi:hypothetical protein